MRIEKCYFCSSNVYPGKGIMFVRNDSKAFRFCRSKCHKNFKMKRNPRKVAWTKAFRRAQGKDMTLDSTFEFEKRRNVPVKYNREKMESTLKAMKRVLEIRQARQARFIKNRLQPDLEAERADNIKEIEKNIDLVLASTSQKRKEVDHFIKEVKGDREMEVE
ncbi:hypothetical protein MP638_001757 [Amoeboaphelidium occidentale]|nr:hypothetical protein MP638_001757 [Amoeboaphelidium occidentale]